MNTKLIALLTSFVVLSMILVAFSLSRPAVSFSFPDTGITSAKFCLPPERGPRALPLSSSEILSLEEVREKAPFWVRVPTPQSLPTGFSFKAAIYDDQGVTSYKGIGYPITAVHLLFWDQDLTNETTYDDVSSSRGLWLEIMHGPGENSTDPFRPKSSRWVGYLWGYPSIVAENYVEVYHFEQSLSYRLRGCYFEEKLMAVMESLIVRG